jgi:uncharacterized paraquat-inducible protein A
VSAPAGQSPGFRCPRCGAELERDQEWCLRCGTAARTVMAATPRWRLPLALIGVVAVLCGAALAWAFVALTNNDDEVRAATAVGATTASTVTVAPATPTTTTPPATVPPAAPTTPTVDPGG